MQCRHCFVAFYSLRQWEVRRLSGPNRTLSDWVISTITCPTCYKPTIYLLESEPQPGGHRIADDAWEGAPLIYPLASQRPVDAAVPEDLKADYFEAMNVLPMSTKASAALSRRILQAVLSRQGYRETSLAKQIETVLGEQDPRRRLPSTLHETIDAVRNFGNFSAHPITDSTSLQVIDVEPGEAEWCLEIVAAVLDYYYVKPATNAKKLGELNQKLKQAGKPPAKR